MKRKLTESAAQTNIREFINHICNGDLANANLCLDTAVKEKVKALVRKDLQKETK